MGRGHKKIVVGIRFYVRGLYAIIIKLELSLPPYTEDTGLWVQKKLQYFL